VQRALKRRYEVSVGPKTKNEDILLRSLKKRFIGYRERFKVKPGLTGWHRYRGIITPRRKIKYDMI